MLIISQNITTILPEKTLKKEFSEKKLKSKCCKKYKKDKRCKRCPCFDLVQKAS